MYAGFGQADVVCVTDAGDVQAGEGGDWQGRGAGEIIKVNYLLRSVEVDKPARLPISISLVLVSDCQAQANASKRQNKY